MSFTFEHWGEKEYGELLAHLQEICNEKYCKFHSGLVPHQNMVGVSIPQMQSIAKEIAKGNWQEFLEIAQDERYEEMMIQGLVIGFAKADIDEILRFATKFIPKINNWAVCDCFCTGFKITKKNPEKLFHFITQYCDSKSEFELRFVAVMLLSFYCNEDYIDRILQIYDNIQHEGYYTKMGVAWGLSTGVVKCPKATIAYLQSQNKLDKFTHNKAIQKSIESYRVDDQTKAFLRSIKR